MNALLIDAGLAGAAGAGMILAEAGLAKLRHRALVPGVVANYRLLPDALVAPVAVALPLVELVLGMALIGGVVMPAQSAWPAVAAAGLFVLFGVAMAINLRRGRRAIDCGCGHAHLRQPLHWALVMRNGLLALLVALRALAPADGAAGVTEIALALVAGLAVFLIYLMFNAIVALTGSPLNAARPSV
jgi:hypothetical protein